MAQLIMSEGLHLDCVSTSELYTALKPGFPKGLKNSAAQ